MKRKLKIAIVIRSIYFTRGGIEFFGSNLANWLTQLGHSILVLSAAPRSSNDQPAVPLNSSIKQIHFSAETVFKTRQDLLDFDADLCVALYSGEGALFWLQVLKETGIPLLYSEHSNPFVIIKKHLGNLERNCLLICSDTIHLLAKEFIESVPAKEQYKVWHIPNFCRYSISKIDRADRRERVLLSLGRLDRNSKQLHLLIDAFALIKNDYPCWRLQIWGEGEDYHRLQSLIQKKDLNEVVQLKGETTEAELQYRASDLFCIPSQYEGFGLTVVEAMAHGLPVIGFAECSGVNWIVQDGMNGVLAPEMSATSLAQALSKLMGDDELRQKMGDAALVRAADFDKEAILTQWEKMIYECASHKGNTALQRMITDSKKQESNEAQLNLLWRFNATFEERMEYFHYPLVQYVHYKRNKWFVKWPWKAILFFWKTKMRLKSLFQNNLDR